MFKTRNVFIAVAVSVLLAACGGGGDDAPSVASGSGSGTGAGTGTGGGAGAIAGTFPGAVNVQDSVLLGNSTDFAVPVAMFATPPAEFPNGVSFAKGTNAPIAQIGLRSVLTSNDGIAAGTTQNGRIAVSMVERASSVGTGEQAESLQVLVPVTYTSTATGGATYASNGQAVIVYKSKAGATQTANVDATNLVKSVPLPDDPTSSYLTVDLDAAVAKAGAAFASAQTMAGSFETGMTLSNIPVKAAAGGAEMAGPAITVNGTAVTGGGVAGLVNVDPS